MKQAEGGGRTMDVWLAGGRFYCDDHKPPHCMPFFYAPPDAERAECSHNAPTSYLQRERKSNA